MLATAPRGSRRSSREPTCRPSTSHTSRSARSCGPTPRCGSACGSSTAGSSSSATRTSSTPPSLSPPRSSSATPSCAGPPRGTPCATVSPACSSRAGSGGRTRLSRQGSHGSIRTCRRTPSRSSRPSTCCCYSLLRRSQSTLPMPLSRFWVPSPPSRRSASRSTCRGRRVGLARSPASGACSRLATSLRSRRTMWTGPSSRSRRWSSRAGRSATAWISTGCVAHTRRRPSKLFTRTCPTTTPTPLRTPSPRRSESGPCPLNGSRSRSAHCLLRTSSGRTRTLPSLVILQWT
mmetsp:Transcript_4516/g.11341  ORF Transcript_4516/g.11341 Transcript_4516/m.11341 type:complete len:291 (+) Transcript_4516:2844-3716(+)